MVDFSRPDIVLIDRKNKTVLVIDIPMIHNLSITGAEKITNYENLALEIQKAGSLTMYLYSEQHNIQTQISM
jgi:hypothetical protein